MHRCAFLTLQNALLIHHHYAVLEGPVVKTYWLFPSIVGYLLYFSPSCTSAALEKTSCGEGSSMSLLLLVTRRKCSLSSVAQSTAVVFGLTVISIIFVRMTQDNNLHILFEHFFNKREIFLIKRHVFGEYQLLGSRKLNSLLTIAHSQAYSSLRMIVRFCLLICFVYVRVYLSTECHKHTQHRNFF